MTLIDTSAWIEFFRKQGHRATKQRVATLLELGEAAYTGPILFELLSGARRKEVSDIEQAFSYATLLPFDEACWRAAADLEATLRARGVTVPRDDVFVAAAARHHRVPLSAADAHFTHIRDRGRISLVLDLMGI